MKSCGGSKNKVVILCGTKTDLETYPSWKPSGKILEGGRVGLSLEEWKGFGTIREEGGWGVPSEGMGFVLGTWLVLTPYWWAVFHSKQAGQFFSTTKIPNYDFFLSDERNSPPSLSCPLQCPQKGPMH